MSEGTGGAHGIGFVNVLALVFIVLKLTEVIDWSWWWVLSPFWIGLILGILVFGLLLVLYKKKGLL